MTMTLAQNGLAPLKMNKSAAVLFIITSMSYNYIVCLNTTLAQLCFQVNFKPVRASTLSEP